MRVAAGIDHQSSEGGAQSVRAKLGNYLKGTIVRIATWNTSNGDLDRVRSFLDELDARVDVLVLTECRKMSDDDQRDIGSTGYVWWGDDVTAGLSVITFGNYGINSSAVHVEGGADPAQESEYERTKRLLRWTRQVEITGPVDFRLVAVWADNRWAFRPAHVAVERALGDLDGRPLLIVGDFNNGDRWFDESRSDRHHRHLVERLSQGRIVSAFHAARSLKEVDLPRGSVQPTFWSGYDEHKGDHIDFVYAPDTWISNEASTVTVGCFDDYASAANRRSDHAPVIAELTPKPLR